MKTLLSIFAFCLLIYSSVLGQFVHSSTSVSLSGDTAIVFMAAGFNFQSGNPECPPLHSYTFSSNNNNLELNLFYDIAYVWITEPGCATRDTIYITGLNAGNAYSLKLVTNTIRLEDTTFAIDDAVFNFTILNTQPETLPEAISLYPNPTTEAVTINFNGTSAEIRAVEILDIYGRLIREVELTPAQTELSISVSELPVGMYLCTIKEGNKVRQLKFVKQ